MVPTLFRGRTAAQADVEALIRDHGGGAYGEARRRQRDVVLPDGTTQQAGRPRTGGELRSSRRA